MDLGLGDLPHTHYYVGTHPTNEVLAVASMDEIYKSMIIEQGYEERLIDVWVDSKIPMGMFYLFCNEGMIGEIEIDDEAKSKSRYLH